MSERNKQGASATYRGYRNQALYVLFRILIDTKAEHRVYRPEGSEDLAIFDSDENLIEAIQVKDHSSDLALSHFKPDSDVGFFQRLQKRHSEHPDCVTFVASFGPLGPEISGAIEDTENHRPIVVAKLNEKSPVSLTNPETLLDSLKGNILHPVAADLEKSVLDHLSKSMAGAHAQASFGILMYWIFRASEEQDDLTRLGLITKIDQIGEYLAALRDLSKEWGTSVVPVTELDLPAEEKARLQEEFRKGIQARWEHIVADSDVPRPDRLEEINRAFQQHACVIIQGASGQGKSSIAWRYLHDYTTEGLRFHVRIIEGREHANRIASALRAHIQNLNLSPIVFLDIAPSDSGWVNLVQSLTVAGIKVIVAVREEDLSRAGLALNQFDHASINVAGVTENEGRSIFEALNLQSSSAFLDFDEAWSQFTNKSDGPLLEFTHLVNEGDTLLSCVSSQIKRIQDEVANSQTGLTIKHLNLLSIAALANSAEAHVDVNRLCELVDLSELLNPLQLLEQEYLLRTITCDGGARIIGLHPLRSRAIVEALYGGQSEGTTDAAVQCLRVIVEEDIEEFLRYAFSSTTIILPSFLPEVFALPNLSWRMAGGIARALLWLGTSNYEINNRKEIAIIVSQYNAGWRIMTDCTIGMKEDKFESLFLQMPGASDGTVERTTLIPKIHVFDHFCSWANTFQLPPLPTTAEDWIAVGDVSFWVEFLEIEGELFAALASIHHNLSVDQLSVFQLSELVSGLSRIDKEAFTEHLETIKPELISKFLDETDSVVISEDGGSVEVLYVLPDFDDDTTVSKRFNEESMNRINLLKKLFPFATSYGARCLGTELLSELLGHDPSLKQIETDTLYPERSVWLNALFDNLVTYRLRRDDTWREYVSKVYGFRETTNSAIRLLFRNWEKLCSRSGFTQRTLDKLPVDSLIKVINEAELPPLPKPAVDSSGLVSEGSTFSATESDHGKMLTRYQGWLKSSSNFSSVVQHTAREVNSFTNAYSADRNSRKREKVLDQRLFVYNLGSIWLELDSFQREFRRLFSHFIDSDKLEQLEQFEQTNFRNLWAITAAMYQSPQKGLTASGAILVKSIAQRRLELFRIIEEGLKSALEEVEHQVFKNPLRMDGVNYLAIACDHENLKDLTSLQAAASLAIIESARGMKWENLEWQPVVAEFPSVAIFHTIKGRLLSPAAAVVSSETIFIGSADEIDLKPHHFIPIPMPYDALKAWGFNFWSSPILRATLRLSESSVTLWMKIQNAAKILADLAPFNLSTDELDFRMKDFISDLSSHWSKVNRDYRDILNLLNALSAPNIEGWISVIQESCEIRMKIDPNSCAEWTVQIPSMESEIANTETEYSAVITDMIEYSIGNFV